MNTIQRFLSLCVCVFATHAPSNSLASSWPETEESIRSFGVDIAESANQTANIQVQVLTKLAKDSSQIELTAFQKTLAFEIFFGIARTKFQTQKIAEWLQEEERGGPIVIWINTLVGKGNSVLMPLIAKVLGTTSAKYYLPKERNDYFRSESFHSMRQELAAGKTLILEDISAYFHSNSVGTHHFFRDLIHDIPNTSVVLAINDRPELNRNIEASLLVAHSTPPMSSATCEDSLSLQIAQTHEPTSTVH